MNFRVIKKCTSALLVSIFFYVVLSPHVLANEEVKKKASLTQNFNAGEDPHPECVSAIKSRMAGVSADQDKALLHRLEQRYTPLTGTDQDARLKALDKAMSSFTGPMQTQLKNIGYSFGYGVVKKTGTFPLAIEEPHCSGLTGVIPAAFTNLSLKIVRVCDSPHENVANIENMLRHEYVHVIQANRPPLRDVDLGPSFQFKIGQDTVLSETAKKYTTNQRLMAKSGEIDNLDFKLKKSLSDKDYNEMDRLNQKYFELRKLFTVNPKFQGAEIESMGLSLNLPYPHTEKEYRDIIAARFKKFANKPLSVSVPTAAKQFVGSGFEEWITDKNTGKVNSCWKENGNDVDNFLNCGKAYAEDLRNSFNKFQAGSTEKDQVKTYFARTFPIGACRGNLVRFCMETQAYIVTGWTEVEKFSELSRFGLVEKCMDPLRNVAELVTNKNWADVDQALEQQARSTANHSAGKTVFNGAFGFDGTLTGSSEMCTNPPDEKYFESGCQGDPRAFVTSSNKPSHPILPNAPAAPVGVVH